MVFVHHKEPTQRLGISIRQRVDKKVRVFRVGPNNQTQCPSAGVRLCFCGVRSKGGPEDCKSAALGHARFDP